MAENLNERLAREYTAGQIDTERAPAAPTLFTPTEDMPSVVRSVKALKQAVDQLIGRNGTAYDKAVSMRDLVASGVLALKIGGTVIGSPLPTAGSGGNVVIPAEPDGPGYRDPRPVLAVPPVLTEVQAHGAFRNIIVVWKRAEYRNHAHVEVWRSLADNLATATRLATTTANLYADATGQPGTTYYYWVRAVNIEGAIGPFNAVAGTAGTLAPLVDEEVPPQFIKRAMIALAAIDDALIANLSAAKVTFGEMSGDRIAANSLHGDKVTTNTLHGDKIIANTVTAAKVNGFNLVIYSGTYTGYAWPATGTGFYLGPQGLLVGNANTGRYFQADASGDVAAPGFSIINGNATFAGALSAATGSFRGYVAGGVYSSWAWPAAGAGNGFYLGPEGLLIGNPNDNLWFMAATNGDISAPGFSVAGGVLTISQANVINTLNIAGEAVTVPRSAFTASAVGIATGTGYTTIQTVDITSHGQKVLLNFGSVINIGGLAGGTSVTFQLLRGGTVLMGWTSWGAPGASVVTSMPPFIDTPAAGTYTYTIRAQFSDTASSADALVVNRALVAMEVQR